LQFDFCAGYNSHREERAELERRLAWLVNLFTTHREPIWRRRTRVSIVALLCCAILGGTLGFPAPRKVVKDRSTPFPCQDKPCGCQNAAACWKSCCCHTNAQKVAWAKQHGVAPPEFVVAAAKREACASGSCCAAKHAPARPAAKTDQTETTLVTIGSLRKCQGLPPLWVLLGETTLSEFDGVHVSTPVAGEWLCVISQRQTSTSAVPDPRPPRA
jgi:hypothetical protein